ncbi:MAG: type II toxin-antitoxin system VapC family toxin [Candidatus Curtissbacteria bacterium]
MNALVIDTSVFVKWLNQDNEGDLDKADRVLEDVKSGKVELVAPELIKYEIGNVLLKGKQLTPTQAYVSLGTAYALPVTFISESEELARETFLTAANLNITYYDASFISLAKQYDATLVTDNLKHQGKNSNIKVVSLKDY